MNLKRTMIAVALAGVACGAWSLRAQEEGAFATPEAAAQALGIMAREGVGENRLPLQYRGEVFSAGALEQTDPDLARDLVDALVLRATSNPVRAGVTSRAGSRATVRVELDSPRELPPVVCVQVGAGWKVDALATARE